MREVKLITGTALSGTRDWQIEGARRMLYNNAVQAADLEGLVVYGGGKFARNWKCFDAIDEMLLGLDSDQTLLVQSGKPVGVSDTHLGAPRVLIVNSMLVPMWSTFDEFRRLEAAGLTMYGQMTAGSWAFIGGQGILQGTYETFVAAGAKPGTLVVSAGLGNMGNAQALAGKMAGAVTLIAEIDPAKIARRQEEGWIDEVFLDPNQAIARAVRAKEGKEAISIAVQANVVDLLVALISKKVTPDILTDQTAAHDPLNGYFAFQYSFEEVQAARAADPVKYIGHSKAAMARHVELMLELNGKGATVFDYGNGLRSGAKEGGCANAFGIKGFVPLYIRPLFCEGRGPFRVAALSGDPKDIAVIDRILLELFGGNKLLANWIEKAQKHIDFSKQRGLPARVCWLGMGERFQAVTAIWRALCSGLISAPIWVGRDHLDTGSVASPMRETEDMKDGSDAIADWPILNALVNAVSGATWVSVHNGGGVGIGRSIHAGQCFVITPDQGCLEKARRVFTNDPALGILRHADAGYDTAKRVASEHGLIIPMPQK